MTTVLQSRWRVLLIEDDAWIRAFLRDALADEGYLVSEAADGRTGLALAARERPDVVLLDLALPELNGMSVVHELGRGHRTRNVPVLVMSSFTPLLATPDMPPVAGVIAKPIDLATLLAAMRRVVGSDKVVESPEPVNS